VNHANSRSIAAFALGAVVVFSTLRARAQDVSAAANAFARAQKAELAGDFEGAAELYELADSIAPAPEALRSALKARKEAGQLATAAIHAEALLERYPDEKRSTDFAKATLEEAMQRFVRYHVRCVPTECSLVVDGSAVGTEDKPLHVVYLEPGKHELRATFGNRQTAPISTEGVLGAGQSLTFEAPPREEEPAAGTGSASGASGDGGTGGPGDSGASSRGGLPPWVFITGAVVTAGVGGVAIWSGLDVVDAHEAYDGNESRQKYNDGKDKEKRTNWLIGATAVTGAATIVIAAFTNWKGKSRTERSTTRPRARAAAFRPEAFVGVGGVSVGLEGRF
jgi:hypothetical protein